MSVGQIAGITIGIMAVGMIVVMIASGRATTTLNRFVTLADQAEGEKGVTGASRWLYWPAAVRYYSRVADHRLWMCELLLRLS